MLPVVEQLLVLQDRDMRLAQLKAELARLPVERETAAERLTTESGKLAGLRDRLRHLEADRKKLEIDADSRRAQVDKYRVQLNQIKSNTEYQALLKEIARAEEAIREVEDRELELMEEAEQTRPAVKQEQDFLQEVTAKVETQQGELQRRETLIRQELGTLQVERAELAEQVEEGVRGRYERLLRSKGDAALVPVRNGNCGGCHLNLPPQVAHDAKTGGELTSCDYCGRILYYPRD